MRGLPDHRLIPTESRSVRRLAGRTLDERFEACMIQSVVVGIVPDCKVHQPQVKPRALGSRPEWRCHRSGDIMKTLFLAILLPFIAFCQPKDIKYLVVKGKAEVQIPVDFLEVSVSLASVGPSFKAANDSNRVHVFEVFNVLRHFAIPDSDFQTTDNSSSEDYSNKDPQRHFWIHYNGMLHVSRPGSYDSLFQALVSIGDVSMRITGFRSSRLPYYRMLAYRRAVDAARAEAVTLLKGSHQSIGKIIKLIQDDRDVFTKYDDIEQLLEGVGPTPDSALMITVQQTPSNSTTFRRNYFSDFGEVTVIFEIK